MSLYAIAKRVLSVILHLAIIALLVALTTPIFRWYLSHKIIPGSDFYNTGTYLQKLNQDIKLPPQKWLYHWFSGDAMIFDYPNLHLYGMLPLVKEVGIILAQNYYALASLGLLVIFSYLLFWEVSRDRFFAAILAVGLTYSANLYPSLTTIGSVTFFASQFFLPLSLYLLEKWRRSGNMRFFYLSTLATGIAMFGHPTVGLVVILPTALLLIYFGSREERFKKSLLYGFLSILVGSAGVLHFIGASVARFLPGPGTGKGFSFTDIPGKEGLWQDFFGINILLILTALLLSVTPLLGKGLKAKVEKNPYLAPLLYFVAWNLLLYLRLNPLSSLLNWYRSLWPLSFMLGAFAAFHFFNLGKVLRRFFLKIPLYVLFLAGLVVLNGMSLAPIENRTGGGYVYPGFINKNVSTEELEGFKGALAPWWLDKDSKQERLYVLDDRINMWWNAFFDLPLVRGYFPGLPSRQEGSFLNQLDISLMDNLMVAGMGTTQERAENAAHFYLDWYAIRYLATTGRFSFSSYLETETYIKQEETIRGVSYLELQEGLSSPILEPTDAPTLCIIGSSNAYNYFLRGLARFNLDSKALIPIKGPIYIDDLKQEFLDVCDTFVLYDARTRILPPNPIATRAGWRGLEAAIRSGKSIYIETGEAKSAGAGSHSLPAFFPINQTRLEPLEKEWELETSENVLLEDVDTNLFSPPVWEDYPWKLSFSPPDGIRSWAGSVLKNKGNSILVSGTLGEGKVIWGGFNLPFHMDYYDNEEEAELFLNIIEELIDVPEDTEADQRILADVEWISPEKRTIIINEAKGILFRERWDAGWKAGTSDGEKLPIYPAGPNYPGFMYIPLLNGSAGTTVTLSYLGAPIAWFYYLITLVTIGFLLDEIIFGGRLLSKRVQGRLNAFFKRGARSAEDWWDEEKK